MLWFLGIVAIIILYLIYIYNNLVSLKNRAKAAWSDIEVQLKKRFNLVPNLIEIVKSYKEYEASTLEKIVKARNIFLNAKKDVEKIEASRMLSEGLRGIFALAESYPNLKADTQFSSLQEKLMMLENDIEGARRYYNATVRDYNTKIESFPDMLIANYFHFKKMPLFEAEKEVYEVPEVKI